MPSADTQPPQGPPVFTATAQSLLSDAERIISRTRELHASLVKSTELSYATISTVLVPLAQAENALITESRILLFYKSVSPDASLRDASEKAKNLFDAFKIETAMNESLFKLVDAVLQRNEQSLDPESRRFLEHVHRDHIANGLSLPAGPERQRFKAIKARLSELEGEFLKKLSEARSTGGGIWFTKEELDGVPDIVLARLESGVGENLGKLRVSFSNSDFFPVLRSAKDGATRKRIYIAVETMCAASVPVFKEAVILRDEGARLLGYPNHAALSTKNKMVQTPEKADKFLNQLKDGLHGVAMKEVQKLKQLKRENLEANQEPFDGRFFLWDYSFHNSLELKKDHAIDMQSVSEYFPLNMVVPTILDMFQKLIGFRFIEVCGENRSGLTWHEDVQVFSVWDAEDLGGGFVGYLYLDLFPREGKVGHACSLNLVPGITKQYPATALLCSFPKPDSRQPSPLRHGQVVLLFHELGHCIHDLASKPTYARFHGPEGTALDFSEAPSQLLEYWFWSPSILKATGRHYSYLTPEYLQTWTEKTGGEQPPERLPDEIIERLVATKNVNMALHILIQVAIGVFDMTVHSPPSHEAIVDMDMSATYNIGRRNVCPLEDLTDLGESKSWGHGFAIYPHLMEGYDAGFYSYLFSKVYSADIFHAKFEANPMNAEEGRIYRKAVLEKGGIQDELKMLTEYLGREPQMDAFCQELGIA